MESAVVDWILCRLLSSKVDVICLAQGWETELFYQREFFPALFLSKVERK